MKKLIKNYFFHTLAFFLLLISLVIYINVLRPVYFSSIHDSPNYQCNLPKDQTRDQDKEFTTLARDQDKEFTTLARDQDKEFTTLEKTKPLNLQIELFDNLSFNEKMFISLSLPDVKNYIEQASLINFSEFIGCEKTQAFFYSAIGPIAISKFFRLDIDLISIFYFCTFIFFIFELRKKLEINSIVFISAFLLNPLILFSFFGPNKDITAILSILFVSLNILSDKKSHLIIALILAYFSKIYFLFFLLIFYCFRKMIISKYSRFLSLLAIISIISIFYVDIPGVANRIPYLIAAQNSDSFGIEMFLEKISEENFSYFLVIIPRIILIICEGGASLFRFQSIPVWLLPMFISGTLIFLSLSHLIYNKLIKLDDDISLLLILYMIFISIIPFTTHRYCLPTYPLILLMMLRENKVKFFGKIIHF